MESFTTVPAEVLEQLRGDEKFVLEAAKRGVKFEDFASDALKQNPAVLLDAVVIAGSRARFDKSVETVYHQLWKSLPTGLKMDSRFFEAVREGVAGTNPRYNTYR